MAIQDQVSQGVFNPTPPDTNDPKFDYARQIERPKFISSTGIGLETAGNVMSTAIKSMDEVIQAYAKDDTRVAMTNLRTERSSELDAIEEAVRGRVAFGPGNNQAGRPGTATDLLASTVDMDPSKLPPEIRNMKTRLAALVGAKANGSITDVHYAATADAELSRIRSRYGDEYRPIIDATASSILGWDPANHKIASQMAAINTFLAAKQEDQKAIRNQFIHLAAQGDITADRGLARFDATGDTYEALRFIASRNADKNALEHAKIQADARDLDLNEKKKATERYAAANATITASNWMDEAFLELEARGVRRGENGNWIAEAGELEQLGQTFINKGDDYKAFLRRFLDTADMGGSTFTQLHGPKAREEFINESVKPFEEVAKRIYQNDTGQIHAAIRIAKGMVADADLRLLKSPEFGGILQILSVLKDRAGSEATNTYFGQANVAAKLTPSELAKYTVKADYASQSWDKPYPLKTVIEKLQKTPFDSPKVLNDLIDTFYGPRGLLNPKLDDRTKMSMAVGLGSEKARGFISNIDDEYVDQTGVHHEGKMDAWNKVTSKPVADEMAQLAARTGDWRAYDGYKDNMISEFKAGFLAPEMRKLADVSKWAKLEWHVPDGKNGVYEWRFQESPKEIDAGGAKMIRRAGYRGDLDPTRTQAQASINRVNAAIRGVVNIARAAEVDPNEAILTVFKEMGFNLAGDNIKGIPASMVAAIKASEAEKKARTDQFQGLGR